MLLAQTAFVGGDPLTARFETRIGLLAATQCKAQAYWRTLADISVQIDLTFASVRQMFWE
jgi:hypothetical protein